MSVVHFAVEFALVAALLWTICGLVAFATHLVRRRLRDAYWSEVAVLMIAATFLGPIALVASITNDHTGI